MAVPWPITVDMVLTTVLLLVSITGTGLTTTVLIDTDTRHITGRIPIMAATIAETSAGVAAAIGVTVIITEGAFRPKAVDATVAFGWGREVVGAAVEAVSAGAKVCGRPCELPFVIYP